MKAVKENVWITKNSKSCIHHETHTESVDFNEVKAKAFNHFQLDKEKKGGESNHKESFHHKTKSWDMAPL